MKKFSNWWAFREEFSHHSGRYDFCDSFAGYDIFRRSSRVSRMPAAFWRACLYMGLRIVKKRPIEMSWSDKWDIQRALAARLSGSSHLRNQ